MDDPTGDAGDAPADERLTPLALFTALARMIYGDGVMEAAENDLFNDMARILRIDGLDAVRIAREAKQAGASGDPTDAAPADAPTLYANALRLAAQDGRIDGDEAQILRVLRGRLRIDDDRHRALVESLGLTESGA